ncbi:hypothetical protein [Curvivirga aplysinae]|uniref:hypothetical protein n=1 Tax=Curvivirga aplysinae TaxID=2529852 RepID=UPI0012BB8703|nr:hypothetical protein [Curvivirga aplysinae]MTI10193.1 hypothetical protein [Curvivirga aplysinae]
MSNALYTGKTGFNGAKVLTSLRPVEPKTPTNALRVGAVPRASSQSSFKGRNGEGRGSDHTPTNGSLDDLGEVGYENVGTVLGAITPIPGASFIGKAAGARMDTLNETFKNDYSHLDKDLQPTNFNPVSAFFNEITFGLFGDGYGRQNEKASRELAGKTASSVGVQGIGGYGSKALRDANREAASRNEIAGRDVNSGNGLGGQNEGSQSGSKGGDNTGGFGPSW